jgi:chromosome segregation ATPase
MTDLIGDLDKRLAEVQAQFDALDAERKRLLEQRAGQDRRLADIQAECLRLDGKYLALTDLKKSQGVGGDGEAGAAN